MMKSLMTTIALLLLGLVFPCFAAEPIRPFLQAEINVDDAATGRSAIPRYWSVREFITTLPPGEWHEDKGTWSYAAGTARFSCTLAPARHTDGTRFVAIETMVVDGSSLAPDSVAARLRERFFQSEKGKTAEAFFVVRTLVDALELYHIDTGTYPGTEEGLGALLVRPALAAVSPNCRGPYLEGSEISRDPWGNPYRYRSPGEHGAFDLFSYGADGKEGGDGKDQDIRSWDLVFRNWQP